MEQLQLRLLQYTPVIIVYDVCFRLRPAQFDVSAVACAQIDMNVNRRVRLTKYEVPSVAYARHLLYRNNIARLSYLLLLRLSLVYEISIGVLFSQSG